MLPLFAHHKNLILHGFGLRRSEGDAFGRSEGELVADGNFGAEIRVGGCPLLHQIFQKRLLRFFAVGFGIGFQCQRQLFGKGGGFAQITQPADALQVGRLHLLGRERDFVGIISIKVIHHKIHIAHLAAAAIGLDEAALLHQRIAASQAGVDIFIGGVERCNAQLFKRKQFRCCADAV